MSRETEHPLSPVAGVLASSVAETLSAPLRRLRDHLATMVETLDRHIAGAEGPEPLPWKSVQALRQELVDAYLLSRETARTARELHDAVTLGAGAEERLDINRQVEAALELLRHHIPADIELFVDLGSVPPVHAAAGEVVLVVAQMVLSAAESAAGMDHSAISVQTRHEREPDHDGVLIHVADNGRGLADVAEAARRAIEPVVQAMGGSFECVTEPDKGSVLECRLPAAPE